MERLIDAAAAEMGIDRLELRRRNQIRPRETAVQDRVRHAPTTAATFPACSSTRSRSPTGRASRKRKRESRKRGKLRGLGIGSFLEVTAPPARRWAASASRPTARVTIITGTLDYGQGHAAPFAQVLSEKLGIPFERIRLLQGDSDELLAGGGTGGSRSIMHSGTAIVEAVRQGDRAGQADRLARAGSVGRRHRVRARPLRHRRHRPLDRHHGAGREAARRPQPAGGRAARRSTSRHVSDGPAPSTFPNGCHVAEVEIDPDTGVIEVVKYSSVNDFGTVINPMIVEGQLHGGVMQGIGQALMEMTVYDDDGQFLTGSFMDYALPRAQRLARRRRRRAIRCRPRPIRSASRAAARPAAPAR